MMRIKYPARCLLLALLGLFVLMAAAGAQETNKYTPDKWVELGKGWLADSARQELAIYAFTQAITQDPNYTDAYLARGKAYWQKGQKDLALADYEEALKLDAKNGEAYYRRAVLFFERGKTEAALEDVNRAIAIYPTYQDAYLLRAYIYLYKKEAYQLAIDDYNRLAGLRPDDARVYGERGSAYNKLNKNELALADLNKAIQLQPQEVFFYYGRSHIYGCQGRYAESIADSRYCMDKWKENSSVSFNLAQALELSGDQEGALKNYEVALKNTQLLDEKCLAKIIARLRG